ncbi:MAG: hypothetical protein Q8L39_14545 [Burkholderiales bacterium]|nr:hypothetical protein [Burkholderiales bacterium]
MKLPTLLLKLVITAAILSNSTNIFAGWTKAGKTVQATIFYDAKSIQRNNGRAKMWVLTNFPKPLEIEGKHHQSSKARFEYDCSGEQSRVIGIFFYALPDGKGEVTAAESSVGEWYPIAPNSIAVPLWKAACNK